MSRQFRTVKEKLKSLTIVLKQKVGTQKRASDVGITKVLGVSEMVRKVPGSNWMTPLPDN